MAEEQQQRIPPLVSVGLPIYNGARYLRAALDSILGQTYPNLEIIVVDNDSADEGPQICEEYARRDARLRFFRSTVNIGGFPNHNRVFALAAGEYFVWASHDDLRDPGHIERCMRELLADQGLVLCFTSVRRIGADGSEIPSREPNLNVDDVRPSRRFADLIQLHYGLEPIYGVIRSRALRATRLMGGYADSDRVLLAELGLHGRFRKIDEVLFSRRDHDQRSISQFPSRRERIAWIDPSRAGELVLPFWRQGFEYLRAVKRAPLSWREKLRCAAATVGWGRRNARALRSDLGYLLRTTLRPLLRRVRGTGESG